MFCLFRHIKAISDHPSLKEMNRPIHLARWWGNAFCVSTLFYIIPMFNFYAAILHESITGKVLQASAWVVHETEKYILYEPTAVRLLCDKGVYDVAKCNGFREKLHCCLERVLHRKPLTYFLSALWYIRWCRQHVELICTLLVTLIQCVRLAFWSTMEHGSCVPSIAFTACTLYSTFEKVLFSELSFVWELLILPIGAYDEKKCMLPVLAHFLNDFPLLSIFISIKKEVALPLMLHGKPSYGEVFLYNTFSDTYVPLLRHHGYKQFVVQCTEEKAPCKTQYGRTSI